MDSCLGQEFVVNEEYKNKQSKTKKKVTQYLSFLNPVLKVHSQKPLTLSRR